MANVIFKTVLDDHLAALVPHFLGESEAYCLVSGVV